MKEKHGEGLHYPEEPRIFAMFFMVLDLRLVKIGCRETINFFCTYPYPSLFSPYIFLSPISRLFPAGRAFWILSLRRPKSPRWMTELPDFHMRRLMTQKKTMESGAEDKKTSSKACRIQTAPVSLHYHFS
mgnify:FL=1